MLVLGVQQSDLVAHMLFAVAFHYVVLHVLSRVPRAVQQILTYFMLCVFVDPTLPIYPRPSSSPDSTVSLFTTPVGY